MIALPARDSGGKASLRGGLWIKSFVAIAPSGKVAAEG
jgi:hypothetical protein